MGRKTSVWLADDLAERVKASGVPMAELIRRGLDAGEPPPLEKIVRRVVRDELDMRFGEPQPELVHPARQRMRRCPHQGTRVTGGYCRTCDVVVLANGVLPDDWVPPGERAGGES